MATVLMVIQVLVALALIAVVLIQHGKGADMGASFGGIVKEALANQRLEGLEVSKEAQDAAQLWVKGKISVDEVIRIIKEKHVRRAE